MPKLAAIEKSRRHDAGSTEISIFECALDCLPDGLLLIREGKTIVYANPAFAEIWNIPESIIQSKNDAALLPLVAIQVVDTAAFVGEVERIYRSPENSQDIVRLGDGRVLSRRGVPFEEKGGPQTRIWIFTDVTEAREGYIDPLTGLPNRRAYAKNFSKSVLAPVDGMLRFVGAM